MVYNTPHNATQRKPSCIEVFVWPTLLDLDSLPLLESYSCAETKYAVTQISRSQIETAKRLYFAYKRVGTCENILAVGHIRSAAWMTLDLFVAGVNRSGDVSNP